mgnify:CR=1 FL=1
MEVELTETVYREPDPSLVTTTHITYALHALGLAIGAFGASTVIGTSVRGNETFTTPSVDSAFSAPVAVR